MKFIRTKIPEVVICKPTIFGDNRGYFLETFRQDKLDDFLGYKIDFCQDNESKSSYGVLRGLHYQIPPYSQAKLIRVVQGEILDVAVDMRKNSPTFGNYVSAALSDENKNQLFIPRGFAHGFVVLSKDAIVSYKTDNYYNFNSERGILYNDANLNIDWKLDKKDFILSDKDRELPNFKDAVVFNSEKSINE